MIQTSAQKSASLAVGDLHVCDNFVHLLFAVTDAAAHADSTVRPLILFLEDGFTLSDDLRSALAAASGADIEVINDLDAANEFARLPSFLPAVVRRNVSWSGSRPIRPHNWSPQVLAGRQFGTGYVYHPGFFLSKVAAGHSDRVVMRDSGYANYVRHRVPPSGWLLRLLCGRPPRHQIWGEEPWVDAIQVARPDRIPSRIRAKASRLTLDDLMGKIESTTSASIARAFWGDHPSPSPVPGRRALILTQPIDQQQMCSTSEKFALYGSIADRLVANGYSISVKPHPREQQPPLPDQSHLPAAFPIEAWPWLGEPAFDLAVSLNSTSLVDPDTNLAVATLQLVEAEQFYARHFHTWTRSIDERLTAPSSPAASSTTARLTEVDEDSR